MYNQEHIHDASNVLLIPNVYLIVKVGYFSQCSKYQNLSGFYMSKGGMYIYIMSIKPVAMPPF